MIARLGARLILVLACLTGLGAVAAGRIGYLNITDRDFLREQGEARSVRIVTTSALRGVIRDRRGEPLAVSTPVDTVWLDPSAREDEHLAGPDGTPRPGAFIVTREIVAKLARALGHDAREMWRRVASARGRGYLVIERRIDIERSRRVRALNLRGVEFRREYKRYYPAGEFTTHVVGVTSVGANEQRDRGASGIELAFDSQLAGEPGRRRVLVDRPGRVVRDLEFLAAERPGQELTLTLDLRLQYIAYRELKRIVAEKSASSASLVMLDARTAEVLALANWPSFNPNRVIPGKDDPAWRNHAVAALYEPGSTMKPFTMAAGLETGVVRADTMINTSPGRIRVLHKTIRDPSNKGVLSLGQILAQSSQVGITKISLQLPEPALPSIIQRAGLTERTGIALPGETGGRLPRGIHHPIVRATLAYGYGFRVTPVQLARAYSVFASGGILRPVSLTSGAPNAAGVRVLDPRVAAQISHMLEGIDGERGTGRRARVDGYRIAGKTGTARKVSGGRYDDDAHIAFFAGYAPATNPRIVMVVVVDDAATERAGGGDVAAPVFGRVAAQTLRLLEVPPDGDLRDWGSAI